MKRILMYGFMIYIAGCSSTPKQTGWDPGCGRDPGWDSGRQAQEAYEELDRKQEVQHMNVQQPGYGPQRSFEYQPM